MLKSFALLSVLGMAILSGLGVAPRLIMWVGMMVWGEKNLHQKNDKKEKKRSKLKISTLLYT